MNDQLLMDNYLLVLKSCVEVYIHGTLESSNKDIRNLIKSSLDEILTCQANTYDKMIKCGWYEIQNVNIKEISKVLNNLCESN